jgi:hypothetical protein
MSERIIISACGFIDGTGFGGRSTDKFTLKRWDASRGDSEKDLRWRMVSEAPHDRFGRLDLLSKFAAVAVEMLDLSPPEKGAMHLDMAIVMGTALGCHSVDCEFYGNIVRGEGASPTLFAYTLPNIAIGEIAMRHQIGGPTYCFMAGEQSGLLALWEGMELIKSEEGVRSCICLGVDASTEMARAITARTGIAPSKMRNHAYAFLVEEREYAGERGRSPLAEISRRPLPGANASWETSTLNKDVPKLSEFLVYGDAETGNGRLQFASPDDLGLNHILDVVRCKE